MPSDSVSSDFHAIAQRFQAIFSVKRFGGELPKSLNMSSDFVAFTSDFTHFQIAQRLSDLGPNRLNRLAIWASPNRSTSFHGSAESLSDFTACMSSDSRNRSAISSDFTTFVKRFQAIERLSDFPDREIHVERFCKVFKRFQAISSDLKSLNR